MSLTTRCPACSTRFRVVPDQLKISDGWVRCGHCSEVFDATLHLSAWVPPVVPVVPVQTPVPAPEPVLEPVPEPAPEAALQPGVEPVDLPLPADEPEPPLRSEPPASWESLPLSGVPEPLDLDLSSQLPDDAAVQEAPEEAPVAQPEPVTAPEPEAVTQPVTVPPDDEPAPAPVPGFVQQARRQAFWRSTPVRASLMVLVLLLSALLAAQWALQQRSWLAARHPVLKPWLVQACDALGCTVEPLRRIDAIVIESATLVRRLGQFHSFDIVLQNTADLPLAAPALELSLTDASDRVVARRVFLPQEWPQAVTELAPRATVPVSFRLSIASGDDLPMAGYRALVFYP